MPAIPARRNGGKGQGANGAVGRQQRSYAQVLRDAPDPGQWKCRRCGWQHKGGTRLCPWCSTPAAPADAPILAAANSALAKEKAHVARLLDQIKAIPAVSADQGTATQPAEPDAEMGAKQDSPAALAIVLEAAQKNLGEDHPTVTELASALKVARRVRDEGKPLSARIREAEALAKKKQRAKDGAASALESAKQAAAAAHLAASEAASELQSKEAEADAAELALETLRRDQLRIGPPPALLPPDAPQDLTAALAIVVGQLGIAEGAAHELLGPLVQAAIASVPQAPCPAPREIQPNGEGRGSRSRSRGRAKKPIFTPEEWSAIAAAIAPAPGSTPTAGQASQGPAEALKRKVEGLALESKRQRSEDDDV